MRAPITRPDIREHAAYAVTYVEAAAAALAASGLDDVRDLLTPQCDTLEALVANVRDDKANSGYAPGKWSLKESILHMADAERVFTYRALCIGRGDKAPLASFEQDAYVPESRANARSLADLLAEFRAQRAATITLVNSFDAAAIAQLGHVGTAAVSVRAVCWIIPGHAAHHIALTRDRYLPALT
jgi:hypothetical protein